MFSTGGVGSKPEEDSKDKIKGNRPNCTVAEMEEMNGRD